MIENFRATKFFQNRRELLFGVCALVGLCAALLDALGLNEAPSRNSAIAVVNGEAIPREEYARALSAKQDGLKRPLTDEDRERALNILIDEELIVQQALNIGLARDDRLARKTLVQALIRAAALSPDSISPPSEGDLRALFKAETALFSPPLTATVRTARFSSIEHARAFRAQIDASASFENARNGMQATIFDPPAQAPLGKIADYLGAAARDQILLMQPGDIAGPLEVGGDQLFLWLVDRQGGALENTDEAFAAARPAVEAEWRRRRQERAFEDYVSALRKTARIKRFAFDMDTSQP